MKKTTHLFIACTCLQPSLNCQTQFQKNAAIAITPLQQILFKSFVLDEERLGATVKEAPR